MEKIKTGVVVTLTPKNKNAQERIEQQGSKWLIEAITERILFSDKTGVWLGLRAESKHSMEFRWVHLTDDEHFNVIV